MCSYDDVLAGGPALLVQALTLFSIAASIVFWVWAYWKQGIGLRVLAVPLALWILFGTLDILITARGTYGDPSNEANPLAAFTFTHAGFWGPPIASMLWIALWAGLVLALNRFRVPYAGFVSLGVFYALAFGHLRGFSSWYGPLCGAISFAPLELPVIAFAGVVLAATHTLAAKLFNERSGDR
ncbi:MAG: hypothetical protein AB1295_04725 [Candidatus Micrarchaeota archaeon]